jgi:hypothetical protein
VGEISLPALVRQLGGEPDAGRLRPLGGLGDHQASPAQVPADRRRRHLQVMVMLQVPGDRLRAGIQPLPGQFLAQLNDQSHRGRWDGPR